MDNKKSNANDTSYDDDDDDNEFIGKDIKTCCVHSLHSLALPRTTMSFRQDHTALFLNNVAHHEFHIESKTFLESSTKGYSTLSKLITTIKEMLVISTYAENIQITTGVVKDYENLQNYNKKFIGFKAISIITYDMTIGDRLNTMIDIIRFRNEIINSASSVDSSSFANPSEIPKIILKSTTFSLDEELKHQYSLFIIKGTTKMFREKIKSTIGAIYSLRDYDEKPYKILTMNVNSSVRNQNTQRIPSYYERSYDYSTKAVSDRDETIQQGAGININTQGQSRVTATINANVEIF